RGFDGGGCPGNYFCAEQRLNRPGVCYTYCADSACPADHECRSFRRQGGGDVELCVPIDGCDE
ncbi:MAG: hypothetical protein VX589_21715, partial [Myxococcota bacterium]|nr:hypothetical protein [Myxococcota bacterium]MEE2789975.1 hypothetical protein [Myxococcota bacterium]